MKKIVVILAAFNGEKYLPQQINSILNQSIRPYKIYVNIDYSIDKTLEIVEEYKKKYPQIFIINSNKYGSASINFLNSIANIDFHDFDFVALSDQDDIWYEDKLEKAVTKLSSGFDGYSSNVFAVWDNGVKQSIVKNQPQTKFDYLFESAGPGCTYVFNNKLAISFQTFLKKHYDSLISSCPYHDWFIYAFARVNDFQWFIDGYESMEYRQHSNNLIGANIGYKAFYKRVIKVLKGEGINFTFYMIKIFFITDMKFIKLWAPPTRIGFLRLALFSFYCRRRIKDKIFFFFTCLLLALIFPNILKTHNIR